MAIKGLVEMMKTGKVEVRVYPKEKLHAKAYLFEGNAEFKKFTESNGVGIVGSSNLSLAGMEHNSELNLRTVHGGDYDHLVDWFEELWKDGVEYTEEFEVILGNSWAGKVRTPYEVYIKAIYHEVKDRIEGGHEIDPVWGTTFPKLFDFQSRAVDQALTMFELYGGLILGDVVGLGKTYIGTALLKYLQLQGYRPLIVCPPHLYDMWDKFCVEYEVDAKILSRGKLSREDFELYQDYRYKDRDLVLVDESHHFRNSDSRQYENLHTFMQARDAKAILLTATPYANSAEDIKNQIMLFHSSPETTIPPAEGNLDKFFTKVKKGEADLVDLLRNIMIRRTRRYVLNQWGKKDENGRKYLEVGKDERLYFPNRQMETLGYKIEKVYKNNYDGIVDRLSEYQLTFARYSPGLYLRKEYQNKTPYNELKTTGPKLVALIRHLLLKRMESSLASFQVSIANLINVHTIFLNLLNEGIMPIGEVSQKEMYDTALNEPDWVDDAQKIKEVAENIRSSTDTKYELSAFDIIKLKKDISFDLQTLNEIDEIIGKLTWKTDDKLHRLQDLLSNLSDKKVLVFTEFTSTAKYLDTYLKWKGNKKQVDSGTANHLQILQRFDPENNQFGNEKIKKEDQISLIMSTDVLSEGVNLQAGQVVINYDFHWNPVRLIQRAGRVDRIGSKHEIIKIINFLPDPTIEHDLHLEGVVSSKIDEIQRVIGEDYKILKETENINEEDIYAIYRNQESILDKEDENNPLEPTEFERIIADIQIKDPAFWERFRKVPDGIRSCGGGDTQTGKVLLSCESGSFKSGRIRKYYLIDTNGKVSSILADQALKLLKTEKTASISKCPSNYNELIKAGWKAFLDDIEQIQAREVTGPRKTAAQKWIIDKLMKISNIYGVDRNPLAVDLAALSLWLETLSSGKPLSFLSAHLKVGNSLVGSKIEKIFEKQTTFLESEKGRELFHKNVKDFFMFENLEDDTSNAVRTKIEKYNRIKQKGTIYYDLKFLLDSKLAESFGLSVPALGDYRAKIGENSIDFYSYDVGPKIKELAEKHRFFHWELDFPDIFFDEKGNKKSESGFDCIIGNPPWLMAGYFENNQIDYIHKVYRSAKGKFDLYYCFLELGLKLLASGGTIGMIVPNKFFHTRAASSLREMLVKSGLVHKVIDFGYEKVFDGATNYPCILLFGNKVNEKITYNKVNSDLNVIDEFTVTSKSLENTEWYFKNQNDQRLFDKMEMMGNPLEKLVSRFGTGVQTGSDRVYLMDQQDMVSFPECQQIFRPIYRGRDVRRYTTKISKSVIFPYEVKNRDFVIMEESILKIC